MFIRLCVLYDMSSPLWKVTKSACEFYLEILGTGDMSTL